MSTRALDRDLLADYPPPLVSALAEVADRSETQWYLAGGVVRDWLLGRMPKDLDITIQTGALSCARRLADLLKAAYVPLDEAEGVARVVWGEFTIDLTDFRQGAKTIEADLALRDFTINAMAIAFDPDRRGLAMPALIIDPTNGRLDLERRCLRCCSADGFTEDPLRLLRAFRFAASLVFFMDPETRVLIGIHHQRIKQVSAERILAECNAIMASPHAGAFMHDIAASGLLWQLFPELRLGCGMAQPASHHLDVLGHSIETLRAMETVLAEPLLFFPQAGEPLRRYILGKNIVMLLKWAALFHDLGKPACHRIRDGRITFYNHDLVGAEVFGTIAHRLKWSRQARETVQLLIRHHMWPFHLNNAKPRTGITARACLRLIKTMGADLPGLFLLAMADSLAGQGIKRPQDMEQALAELWREVHTAIEEHVKPVLTLPRLLTGHDLMAEFALPPGPLLGKILNGLERAQVEGLVKTREGAKSWVKKFLQELH